MRQLATLLPVAVLVMTSCASAPPSTAGDEAALTVELDKWYAAYNAKDADAMAELYTEDAVLTPDGKPVRSGKEVVWAFWTEQPRREIFPKNAWNNFLFLGKWLTVAFFLESLMLAYIPAETVSAWIGGTGWLTVAGATLVGIPAYLNGYAALPLVSGLIEQGMAPSAGMAFLLAGGVSSIPAAIAVWALARPPVFAAYLGFAVAGAFSLGLGYGLLA